jgi:hypothetical protein
MEMLSERSLVATAQAEAERIVAESRVIAQRRAEEADTYTIQVLQDLAQRLHSMLQQVENGIQIMQEGRSPRPGPAEGGEGRPPDTRPPDARPPQRPPRQPKS